MATAACYLGQLGVGGWLVATFIVTVLLWDCRYTLRITGDNNVVIGRACTD
ncbi:hypothetical protein [Caenispirillum bisanense]|uniref:Uncharacterized protein n=1 Tax=Caenispirillum bisanense TaxID=414052 RepID=A0A286GZW9_9PROT|nr:hypothetical protein [Caenispirillum bisanense]SOE00639.1 hypothetical protein SAMN05421508_11376 [Caenispirillum bisanense]